VKRLEFRMFAELRLLRSVVSCGTTALCRSLRLSKPGELDPLFSQG